MHSMALNIAPILYITILISGFTFNFSLGKWLFFTPIYLRNRVFFSEGAINSWLLKVLFDWDTKIYILISMIIDTGSLTNSLNLCIETEIFWKKPSKHFFTNRWNLEWGILIARLKVNSEYNQAKRNLLKYTKEHKLPLIYQFRKKWGLLNYGKAARFKDFKRHI